MKVYISGPMRSKPDYNYPVFKAVERELYTSGLPLALYKTLEVINPANNFNGDKTLNPSDYMQIDLEQVLSAEVLVLLPDWEKSEGAKLEVSVAKSTNKSFYKAELVKGVWTFNPISQPTADTSVRGDVLDEAKSLITGDRNSQYGPPTQDFQRTADMASAWGFEVDGKPLNSYHVAIFMMLLKMSRLRWTPEKRDSWVDSAGYAGCGYECVIETSKQD